MRGYDGMIEGRERMVEEDGEFEGDDVEEEEAED